MKHAPLGDTTAIKTPARNRPAGSLTTETARIAAALGSLGEVNMFRERKVVTSDPHPILEAVKDLRSEVKDFILDNLREGATIGFTAQIAPTGSMKKIYSLALGAIETLNSLSENLKEATPLNLNTKALAAEGSFLLTSFLSHVLNEKCGDSVDEIHRFDMVRLTAGLGRELAQLAIRVEAMAVGIPVQ